VEELPFAVFWFYIPMILWLSKQTESIRDVYVLKSLSSTIKSWHFLSLPVSPCPCSPCWQHWQTAYDMVSFSLLSTQNRRNKTFLMFCIFCILQQEEEIQNLQKQIQQLEGDLDTAQTQLAEATTKLENTEKELSKVFILRVTYYARDRRKRSNKRCFCPSVCPSVRPSRI